MSNTDNPAHNPDCRCIWCLDEPRLRHPPQTAKALALVLRHREENGHLHLHHQDCIHNLPPEEQVRVRGKTVEWWMTVVGRMPEQITPEQWQCEPPLTRR